MALLSYCARDLRPCLPALVAACTCHLILGERLLPACLTLTAVTNDHLFFSPLWCALQADMETICWSDIMRRMIAAQQRLRCVCVCMRFVIVGHVEGTCEDRKGQDTPSEGPWLMWWVQHRPSQVMMRPTYMPV